MKGRIYFILIIIIMSSWIFPQNKAYLIGELYGDIGKVTALGDINGDGYADFGVGSASNYVKIYLGGSAFDTSKYVKFIGSTYDRAFAVNKLGDINNDGYDDFAISYVQPSHICDIKIFFGKPLIDTIPQIAFPDNFSQTTPLGDVNGDGFNDFMAYSVYLPITLAKAGNISVGGNAKLFLGSKDFSGERYSNFTGGDFCFLGSGITSIGDFNNDGKNDFIAGYPESISRGRPATYINEACIYFGRQIFSDKPDITLKSNNEFNFGKTINFAGNLSNKTNCNYIIASDSSIYFYSDTTKYLKLKGTGYGCGGDFNGDGHNDFVIANTSYKNSDSVMVGAAWIYYGGKTIDTIPKTLITGTVKGEQFGYSCVFLGDINKDGSDELAITSPSINNSYGKISIFSGRELTGINDSYRKEPENFQLSQNYPNPFNPVTSMDYSIPADCRIKITVYNSLGQIIKVLDEGIKTAGNYKTEFDANDLSSGVYFYSLTAQLLNGKEKFFKTTRKMLLIK